MARSGAAGRVCYLALLLTAGVIFYQHHVAMQRELTHSQRSGRQFEKMYEDSLKTVTEWKDKFEKERMKGAQIQEAHDLTKKQLNDEVQSKQTLQTQKADLEMKIEQVQQVHKLLEAEKRSKEEELAKAAEQTADAERRYQDLQSKLSSMNEELSRMKQYLSSVDSGKQRMDKQQTQASGTETEKQTQGTVRQQYRETKTEARHGGEDEDSILENGSTSLNMNKARGGQSVEQNSGSTKAGGGYGGTRYGGEEARGGGGGSGKSEGDAGQGRVGSFESDDGSGGTYRLGGEGGRWNSGEENSFNYAKGRVADEAA